MTTQMTESEKFQKTRNYKAVMAIVNNYRKVSERASALEAKGYSVEEYPMGSGGVGQVKVMSDHYRIQIGYGVGNHNYAQAVKIAK